MSSTEIAVVIVAGFLSGIIRSGTGAGVGLFLLPTMALAFPAKIALALGAPLLLATDVFGLRYYWKEWIERSLLLRLLLAAVPGVIAGTVLVSIIPAREFMLGVGLFGSSCALFQLFPNFVPFVLFKKNFVRATSSLAEKEIYCYGSLGGVSTVIAHSGGLIWTIYLMNVVRDRRIFVGTTVIIYLITDTYKTFAFLYLGLLSPDSLFAVLPAIPAVWLGCFIGNKANRHLRDAIFRKIVLVVILLGSLKLCF